MKYYKHYSVSEKGIIINTKTNRQLKYDVNSKGYYRITLDGKRFALHRLIALLYIPNPNNYPQINHIDGNKLNNHYTNLEWCTNDYNNNHAISLGLRKYTFINGEKHVNAKLTNQQVKEIKQSALSAKELSEQYNVAKITIYKIKDGSMWKSIS